MIRSALVFFVCVAIAACGRSLQLPPQANLTEIEPSGRAAKSPTCELPILRAEPLSDYRKVAIIEGLGSRYGTESDVMPVVMRRACETGADAIVVLTSKAQTSENLTGYYINAVAIIFVQGSKTVQSGPRAAP